MKTPVIPGVFRCGSVSSGYFFSQAGYQNGGGTMFQRRASSGSKIPVLILLLLVGLLCASCGNPVTHMDTAAQVSSQAANNRAITIVSAGYWQGVGRNLPVTPLGNTVALSCHNCYGASNAATQTQVAMALSRGFDLVEFDLTRHSDGVVYVEHSNTGLPVGTLLQALQNSNLQTSNLMLFIEIKDNYSSAASSDALMRSILRLARDNGYATSSRPLFLRAFMDSNNRQKHLVTAQSLLQEAEFSGIRSNVRFHALLESDVRNGIRSAKALGFHGVEFQYQMSNLFGAIDQAKLLGLGVGVYTMPSTMGEVFLSAFREDVDFITTDYDRGSTAMTSSARSLVMEDTALLHLNAWNQNTYPLTYKKTGTSELTAAQTSTTPSLEVLSVTSDEDRVGGSLVFNGNPQSLTTWDADNTASAGYFVTAVVNFDDLTSRTTRSLLAKSDAGGFALEQAGSVLRFGVYVNGAYTYATTPLSGLNGTDSYFIIGAYDGNGAVRLWVNGSEKTASVAIAGGVGLNDSPVVIGADPQGLTDRRYFFSGKIQQVMVQRWRDH